MGVPGLWKKLKPAERKTTLLELCLEDGFTRNLDNHYRLGIDASIWIYQALHSSSRYGMNAQLKPLFYRCCRLLTLPAHIVFIFDGDNKTEFKREHQVSNHTRRLERDFRKMAIHFGFTVRIAPAEADAELALLNRENIIDGILSEDVDCLVFGASTVIREFVSEQHSSKKNKHIDSPVSVYRTSAILSHPDIGFTHAGLVLFALLNGGDYHKGFGCGPEISHGLARTELAKNLVNGYFNACKQNTLTQFLPEWRQSLCEELKANSFMQMSSKHPRIAQKVPLTFPPMSLLFSYLRPLTSSETEISTSVFSNNPMRLDKLGIFCANYFGWESVTIIDKFSRFVWPGYIMRDLLGNTGGHESDFCKQIEKISDHRVHPAARSVLEYRIIVNVEKLHLQLHAELASDSENKPTTSFPKTQRIWIAGPILKSANPKLVADYRRKVGLNATDGYDEMFLDFDSDSSLPAADDFDL